MESFIDLSPLVSTVLVPIVLPVISALVIMGVWRLVKLTGLKIDDTQRSVVNAALENAISFAENKLVADIPGKVPANVKAATAANYVIKHVPDALAHFKIDPQKLVTLIEARLDNKGSQS